MKTIQIRALYFKAVTPAMKTIDVDDEFFDQIPCGYPKLNSPKCSDFVALIMFAAIKSNTRAKSFTVRSTNREKNTQ